MKQAKEIYEGFTNLIKSKINLSPKELQELHIKRYTICRKCPERNTVRDTCKKCGCYLPAKTRSESSSCPLGHWTSIK